MDKLKDTIYCILKSKKENKVLDAKLVKVVYLANWIYTLKTKKPISPIGWAYNNYGPYSTAIFNIINENRDIFKIKSEGGLIYEIKDKNYKISSLSKKEIKCINSAIKKTNNLNFFKLINYIFKTYPVKVSEKGSLMDLEQIYKVYEKAVQEAMEAAAKYDLSN
jgi:hypothetical protein